MLKVMLVDGMNAARREINALKIWGDATGFAVAYEADNAIEALEKLQNNRVDLVLAEIEMPGMSGMELLEEIMKNELCRCVVLMNRRQDFVFIERALNSGAFDYVSKPILSGELAKVLLRARNYILRMHKHEEKVRMLEERLDEKLEEFFPTVDVRQIVGLIKSGDSVTVEAAEEIFDTVTVILNCDTIKSGAVLRRAVCEIVTQVSSSCKWLHKFISVDQLKSPDFHRCSDMESLKAEFIKSIESIALIMKVLHQEKRDPAVISRIYDYVLTNVDSSISLTEVSEMLYMNRTYVSEIFKQKTGISFIEYVTIVKVERAKKLLRDGDMKIYEIGYVLGFSDTEYFSRLFKKHTGVSLRQYRKEITRTQS